MHNVHYIVLVFTIHKSIFPFWKCFQEKDVKCQIAPVDRLHIKSLPSIQKGTQCAYYSMCAYHIKYVTLVDFPIHIDTIGIGLPIVYFKGSQVEFSNFSCISLPEDCFNLRKQCRPR